MVVEIERESGIKGDKTSKGLSRVVVHSFFSSQNLSEMPLIFLMSCTFAVNAWRRFHEQLLCHTTGVKNGSVGFQGFHAQEEKIEELQHEVLQGKESKLPHCNAMQCNTHKIVFFIPFGLFAVC